LAVSAHLMSIPVPEDLLSSALQANNPDNNEASDTDDGEDTTNNGPDQDDNGDSEKNAQGKGTWQEQRLDTDQVPQY
jgi:hypothetical protein